MVLDYTTLVWLYDVTVTSLLGWVRRLRHLQLKVHCIVEAQVVLDIEDIECTTVLLKQMKTGLKTMTSTSS